MPKMPIPTILRFTRVPQRSMCVLLMYCSSTHYDKRSETIDDEHPCIQRAFSFALSEECCLIQVIFNLSRSRYVCNCWLASVSWLRLWRFYHSRRKHGCHFEGSPLGDADDWRRHGGRVFGQQSNEGRQEDSCWTSCLLQRKQVHKSAIHGIVSASV